MKATRQTDFSINNINSQQAEVEQPVSKLKNYAIRIASLLTFIGNLVIAYLAMYQQNKKMAAEQYFLYIIPSPGFFKIWIFIYATLLLSIIHNLCKGIWKKKSSFIFILSNCLFMIQSGIWSFGTVPAIVIAGFVLAAVDNVIIWFWRVLLDQHIAIQISNEEQPQGNTQVSIKNEESTMMLRKREKIRKYSQLQLLIVRNILSLYIGWITVAGTIILGIACVYWLGLSLCGQFLFFWITTPIAATALYLFMALRAKGQYKYCFGYLFAVIWGIVGAGLASINHITQKNYC